MKPALMVANIYQPLAACQAPCQALTMRGLMPSSQRPDYPYCADKEIEGLDKPHNLLRSPALKDQSRGKEPSLSVSKAQALNHHPWPFQPIG